MKADSWEFFLIEYEFNGCYNLLEINANISMLELWNWKKCENEDDRRFIIRFLTMSQNNVLNGAECISWYYSAMETKPDIIQWHTFN